MQMAVNYWRFDGNYWSDTNGIQPRNSMKNLLRTIESVKLLVMIRNFLVFKTLWDECFENLEFTLRFESEWSNRNQGMSNILKLKTFRKGNIFATIYASSSR